ncbi:MAG: iclR [Sphingomonas bacterium]|nr:IclR family transcriptional regulator C-terminal domain-containing protein [Sphingomonas bacterium]MDB5688821.1 iclR [Sphingomonas bacterium]
MSSDDDVFAGRRETMGGLTKGLAVIEMFADGHDRLTVADAARGADMTRAAARRCLLTLQELGYLQHDGKYFLPLPRLRRIGGGGVTESLAARAQPFLDAARDELNEPVSLAILNGREALFVARADASRMVLTGVRVGASLPVYCSATGRVLLASRSEQEIEAFLAGGGFAPRTPKTITDADGLRSILAAVRQERASISDEEIELGMRSLAVPVHDRGGSVIAACSLSTAAARCSVEQMRADYLPVVQRTAHAIEQAY